jgi:hypothetical protein
MSVSIGGKHLKDTIVNGQERHIKGTSTKIKDEDIGFPSRLVHAIGNGRSSRFINDTFHLHSRDGTRILGSLTLCVIKVGWDSDDGIFNVLSEKCFCRGLHFGQDHCGNFFGSKPLLLATLFDFHHGLVFIRDNVIRHKLFIGLNGLVGIVTPNESFDVKDGIDGVNGGLILGGITDETIAIFHKGHVGRSDTVTLIIGNDFDPSILEDSYTRVGSAEINANPKLNLGMGSSVLEKLKGQSSKFLSALGPAAYALAQLLSPSDGKTLITKPAVYALALVGASSGFYLFLYFITVGYCCGVTLPVLVALIICNVSENSVFLRSRCVWNRLFASCRSLTLCSAQNSTGSNPDKCPFWAARALGHSIHMLLLVP